MKTCQVKILLKNAKPPVWRRCLIPTGITFSQLALILEEITESEQSAAYEFEFYQAGIRLREWEEGATGLTTFYCSYMCPSDTFIDGLIKKEEWFTFRPGDGHQYRVEVEERLTESIPFPSVLKQKGDLQVCGWSDREAVNQRLEQYDPIHYGKPDYRSFEELKKEREEGGRGLTGARRPKDRTDRTKLSASAQLKNFAHMLNDNYLQKMAGNILAELGDGEEINAMDPRSFQNLMEDAAWQMKANIQRNMGLRPADKEESRNPRVKDLLLEETKENLLEMAADLGLSGYKSLHKDALAEKIRSEILKPEVMKKRMLLLSDGEIAAFEKAAAKEKGFYPDRKEMENLEKLYDLAYVVIYRDDYAQVPREAAESFRSINTPAYQEERRGTFWLYHCLMYAEMLYGVAPVEIICRMLKKCLGHKVEREGLEKLWSNIPDELNSCVLQDGKVICKEILRENLYLKIEELQGKKKFYIPGPDEIVEYTENGYPVSDSNYYKLKLFLLEKTNIAMDKIEEYMALVWSHISMGQSLSDILDMFEEEGIQFSSDDDLQEFAPLMMDVNNNTRMLIHRGWTPVEMFRQTPPQPKGQRPKLVPMSSSAAKMLGEASNELKGMGLDVDLDYNADEITTIAMPGGIAGQVVVGKKRIYPNDPCPCGSGKKYKKCCGRK